MGEAAYIIEKNQSKEKQVSHDHWFWARCEYTYIRVRPCENYGQLMHLVKCHYLLTRVIGSIIQQQDCVVPPEPILAIQEPDEASEEELHHL